MRLCWPPESGCKMRAFVSHYFCLAEAWGFLPRAEGCSGGTKGSEKEPWTCQTRGFWPQQQSFFWVCPAPLSPCKDRLVALCPQGRDLWGWLVPSPASSV